MPVAFYTKEDLDIVRVEAKLQTLYQVHGKLQGFSSDLSAIIDVHQVGVEYGHNQTLTQISTMLHEQIAALKAERNHMQD